MEDLDYLKSCADELALHVDELNEEHLTEMVRLTLRPQYVSTDVTDLVRVATNRSGVVVSATFNDVEEAQELFVQLLLYVDTVADRVQEAAFYLLAGVGEPEHPGYEDLVRNWMRFDAVAKVMEKNAHMAGWWTYHGGENEPPKVLLMVTVPDEKSFITSEKLYTILEEQDRLTNPLFARTNVDEMLMLLSESLFPKLGYKVDDVENDIFYAEKEEDGRFLWVMLDNGEDGKVHVSFMYLFVPMDDDSDPQKHFEVTLDVSDEVEGLEGWWNETDGRLMVTYDFADEDFTVENVQILLDAFFMIANDFCANYMLTVAMDEIMDEESE